MRDYVCTYHWRFADNPDRCPENDGTYGNHCLITELPELNSEEKELLDSFPDAEECVRNWIQGKRWDGEKWGKEAETE